MLRKDPEQRLTLDQIAHHPWFAVLPAGRRDEGPAEAPANESEAPANASENDVLSPTLAKSVNRAPPRSTNVTPHGSDRPPGSEGEQESQRVLDVAKGGEDRRSLQEEVAKGIEYFCNLFQSSQRGAI